MTNAQSKCKWLVRPLLVTDILDAVDIVNAHDARHGKLVQRDLEIHFSLNKLPGSYFVVVAEKKNIVGLMGMYDDPDPDVLGICWAVWLYIKPEFRGVGVGKALITHIENEATQRGARKLYLDIGNEAQHPEAINMYLQRGYACEGYLKDYFLKGEHKLIYAKYLNP